MAFHNKINSKSIHHLDPKSRLLIPKDIRNTFQIKKASPLFLLPTIGDHPYLEIRTIRQWRQFIQELTDTTPSNKKKDALRYASIASESVKVDAQGRILITERLRVDCRIKETVVVINMRIFFEVWDIDCFSYRFPNLINAFKEINEKLF